MSALFVGIIAAVVGALLTWGATSLPNVRQSREYKRQLHQTIIGVPAAPGVERRPALVDRVVDVEVAVKDVGAKVTEGIAAASAAADQAIKVAEALPRIETTVNKLQESHHDLAERLTFHMESEEQAITEMRQASTDDRAAVEQSVASLHSALTDHAAEDLRVAEEIRGIASQATVHAQAARKAAETGAEASRIAASVDREVLAGQQTTHQRLDAISSAVGAAEPPDPPEPPGRRRHRS